MTQPLIKKIMNNPKLIFLIDGGGAVLSAFSLGVVLVMVQELIGLPHQTLYILSFIAVLFAIYSFSCAFLIKKGWRFYLKIIATANLSYAAITLGLLFYHRITLTNLGIIYFVLEMAIIIPLALFELKVAKVE